MAKWNLSSSTSAPPWWTESIRAASVAAATQAFPNECCGLYYAASENGLVHLHVFSGRATPWQVDADANDVIRFVYDQCALGAVVYGTFHTHPNGSRTFSDRDNQLAEWGEWHALGVANGHAWDVVWACRESVSEGYDSVSS